MGDFVTMGITIAEDLMRAYLESDIPVLCSEVAWKMYQAFLAKGFSADQAIQLIYGFGACGLPSGGQ